MLSPGPTTRDGVIDQALVSWRRTGSPKLGIDEPWIADVTGRAYDRAFDPGGTLRQFGAIVGSADRRPGLAAVDVPTLVVHGRDDPICTLPRAARRPRRPCPGARLLVFDDMGHDLPTRCGPRSSRRSAS